jgi:hypothetical protein
MLIRDALAGITRDKGPSKWSHAIMLGEKRDDGLNDGGIYIYESDLCVNSDKWQVMNGSQESRLTKWCKDSIEHACVLGIDLDEDKKKSLLRKGLELSYGENLKYPVGELFGTLFAIITGKLNKKNIFDDKYAAQCSTFVRMCYQGIGCEIITDGTDLTNTSPESIYQSNVFTFRKEWPENP